MICIFHDMTDKTNDYKPTVTVLVSNYYKLTNHKLNALLAVPFDCYCSIAQ